MSTGLVQLATHHRTAAVSQMLSKAALAYADAMIFTDNPKSLKLLAQLGAPPDTSSREFQDWAYSVRSLKLVGKAVSLKQWGQIMSLVVPDGYNEFDVATAYHILATHGASNVGLMRDNSPVLHANGFPSVEAIEAFMDDMHTRGMANEVEILSPQHEEEIAARPGKAVVRVWWD
jgi:hypothetical protein